MKKVFLAFFSAFLLLNAFPQSSENRFENRKNTGYYNITQISMLMGNRKTADQYYNYIRNNMQVSPSVTMVNGSMFSEGWGIGIGVGFEIFEHNIFPVFADIRYTVWDNNISPFFVLKMGYAFSDFKKKHYDNLSLNHVPYWINNAYYMKDGGFMLNPEMGVKVPLSKKADLLLTLAYRHQKTKSTVSQDFGQRYKWEHNVDLNRLSLGVAIMFR